MGREQRARQAREMAGALTMGAANAGALLEVGWLATTKAHPMPAGVDLEELRTIYFLGAEHLWSSMMNVLDPGDAITQPDLRRMELLQHEIDAFRQWLKQKYGIRDSVIPAEKGTKQ